MRTIKATPWAEALRNAQLALLESSETNALPYQWAGFVTVGQ